MCGILGYYKAGGFRKEDILHAQRALQALNHRGPDGEGICLIDSHTGKSWTYQTKDTPSDIVTDLNAESYPEGSWIRDRAEMEA